ncbi:restriction endonuclease subunit S [Pseudarcicella hirudinis]|uniref:restriction endonuclease subunit S n=1 Tax=Pseudarcicella hirudinis TaxID=1079859 RepID=UPI0021CEF898|nr:restriction endonuclease subunit S [Pseudarcicella hirudinis]
MNPNVPNLRFKGFEEEWESKRLGEVCEINPKNESLSNLFIYIDLESVANGRLLKEDYIYKDEAPSRAQRVLVRNDILFQMVRPYQKNNLFFDKEGEYVASTGYAQIRTNQNSQFIFQHLHNQKFVDKVIERCTGTSYPAINSTDLGNIQIHYPNLGEQQKIASFLSLIDERITTQNKIIEQLETLIKGLCQELFNEKKNSSWSKHYLKDIIIERKELNKASYSVHSVSVSKGVINQIEYLGRAFASKDTSNYNVVHYGDIVYTKSPTGEFPYGIIKQSFIKEMVAVSPLYGVYKPKSFYLANILHYYFSNPVNTNNYLHSLIQKGAKNTINITNQNFLNKEIYLPSDENQIKTISLLLNSIAQKSSTEQGVLNKLIQQKKFLLQNLFV